MDRKDYSRMELSDITRLEIEKIKTLANVLIDKTLAQSIHLNEDDLLTLQLNHADLIVLFSLLLEHCDIALANLD